MSDDHPAFVGVGSNQGDRLLLIQRAQELISGIPEIKIHKASQYKEYPAEGVTSDQPPYLNGVLFIETELTPLDLLHKLQVIERQMGRSSKGDYKARVIDLDILAFGDGIIIQGKNLIVPHPRMHLRRFVLEPLCEIRPDWVHPKFQRSARALLEDLESGNPPRWEIP